MPIPGKQEPYNFMREYEFSRIKSDHKFHTYTQQVKINKIIIEILNNNKEINAFEMQSRIKQ